MSKRLSQLGWILCGCLILSACIGTRDRILLVRLDDDLQREVRGADCRVRYLDSQLTLIYEDRPTETGRSGLSNPPASGNFFIHIFCGSNRAKLEFGPYAFERDFVVELRKGRQ